MICLPSFEARRRVSSAYAEHLPERLGLKLRILIRFSEKC